MPFELGRPVGAPGDPAFQKRVLRSALALLERTDGPVLEDFPDDEPEGATPDMPLACPVSFASEVDALDTQSELLNAFRTEADGLRSWYDQAVELRGRTTANSTGLAPDTVVDFVTAFARGEEPANPVAGVPLGMALKMATEDLKAYYNESVTAQPGRSTDVVSLEEWFWNETAAARVLNEIRKHCLTREGAMYQQLGHTWLVPRRQLPRFEE